MNHPENPYLPPQAVVDDARDISLSDVIPGGRRVPLRRAFSWIAEGWSIYQLSPARWVGNFLLMSFVLWLWSEATELMQAPFRSMDSRAWLLLVTLLTSAMSLFLLQILSAGWMLGARKLDTGSPIVWNEVTQGSHLIGRTLRLSLVVVLFQMAVGFGFGLLLYGLFRTGLVNPMGDMLAKGLYYVLVFVFALLLASPMLFCPALTALHGTPVIKAVNWSISGFWKNILVLMLMGITVGLPFSLITTLAATASPLLGISLMVLMSIPLAPTLMCATYAAYRDIYNLPPSRV